VTEHQPLTRGAPGRPSRKRTLRLTRVLRSFHTSGLGRLESGFTESGFTAAVLSRSETERTAKSGVRCSSARQRRSSVRARLLLRAWAMSGEAADFVDLDRFSAW
jgi:hypothetical protein